MRAWQTEAGVPTEVLQLQEHTPPAPAKGELQVEVLAAPILPMDSLRLRGLYPLSQALPGVPGSVGVGRVIAGPDSWLNDLVVLPMRVGSWAQQVNVSIEGTIRLPPDINPVQAALCRVNGLTAQALLDGLSRGSWVILNAATGGVSSYVLQLATRMGVNTVAVVRDDDATARVQNADIVLPDGPDLFQRLDVRMNAPIHRALDGVGGKSTEHLASCLAPGGRVLHYGAMSRSSPRVRVTDSIFRGVLLQGFWLYKLDQMRGSDATGTILAKMLELGMEGKVDSTWALSDLNQALLRSNHPDRRGRVVLTPNALLN